MLMCRFNGMVTSVAPNTGWPDSVFLNAYNDIPRKKDVPIKPFNPNKILSPQLIALSSTMHYALCIMH